MIDTHIVQFDLIKHMPQIMKLIVNVSVAMYGDKSLSSFLIKLFDELEIIVIADEDYNDNLIILAFSQTFFCTVSINNTSMVYTSA